MIGWRIPAERMCSVSYVGIERSEWCGTGWTGQPNVLVGEDGTVEVREGAYDGMYHFLDGTTGLPVRPPLPTRDLAKGSATSDPDGFPLYYAGSRDGRFRIVATDRKAPLVLWSVQGATSVDRPLRNDDWDAAALVIDDVLFEGGENGWLYVIRLHRDYDELGLVTVEPEIVATVPGFDDELLRVLDDEEVSIENSVAFHDGILYFANSGGLVQGWDVSDVLAGGSGLERVFRFWTGDDTDATIVIDDAGDLYVASEYQRFDDRSREVGQLMKLDPSRPNDPLVWSIDAREIGFEGAGGSWSTPALYADLVYLHDRGGQGAGGRARDRRHPVGAAGGGADDRIAGGGGRRADPGGLRRRPLGVGRLGAGRRTRCCSGSCTSTTASSPRRLSGAAGSTSGRARATSTG